MDMLELMRARHSVRQYTDRRIEPEKRTALTELAAQLNRASGLSMQILYDEPRCFTGLMSRLTRFKGCANYIAIVARQDDPEAEEKAGYYGEQLVLKAQELGLNTCWVGLTHGKSAAAVAEGQRQVILIALGYGETPGVPHKGKGIADISEATGALPDWYVRGMEGVLLAPTAVNQQKFTFTLQGDTVTAAATGKGPYIQVDLGIAKYHFEAASGHKVG